MKKNFLIQEERYLISEENINICAKIEYDCWKEVLSPILNISEYIYFQTEQNFKTQLKESINNPKNHIILAQKRVGEKNVIAGFALVQEDRDKKVYRIKKFFIAPKYHNQGIGKFLLKQIIKNFQEFPISASVYKANRAMEHLLIKAHFKWTQNRNLKLEYGKNSILIPSSYYSYKKEDLNEADILRQFINNKNIS